ncbi:tyrosine-type recombinase/integrase [Bradyrhizobium sp. HKCCYLS2033]|uniref:tyrosine-type recombinase/integrase n=1 Tax=Bradyrhizobium sp. HKCCYLS2033 TaxID=3420739 RepID=UPI003EBA7880
MTAAGTRSFVLFHRVAGKGYLETLGRWDENAQGGTLTVRDAIVRADKIAKDLKNGRREDPRPERTRRLEDGDQPKDQTVGAMLDDFVERHVKRAAGLRTADTVERTIDRLIKPRIGKLPLTELRRSHIRKMLDDIEDENGPVMADRVLAYVRKALNWQAVHDDDFQSPIIRGMARTKPKDRQRSRILADDEIRDLWAALDKGTEPACYARYVKSLLLCATRRNESADMRSSEIDGNLWIIPGARYKNKKDHVIPLTEQALELISEKPAGIKANGYFIFSTTDGEKPFSGFSKAKRALDKAIAEIRAKDERPPLPAWTLHDLRRTARSLMSRAGVPSDHAERAIGHVMGGVRGVYDRHAYLDEKRAAFEALAALVDRILTPADNVTQMRSA